MGNCVSCGARDLGIAMRIIGEIASREMIDVVEGKVEDAEAPHYSKNNRHFAREIVLEIVVTLLDAEKKKMLEYVAELNERVAKDV